ncbi:hypothetical protein AALO_G00164200 [Alosa alosa]|uniref:Uncharacterized protein n=1 Tax=Alosa alosa TaxID=278164 RepID=A0AAV6GB99_9TELE|nr:hypothetical protein AALO_G00164200 [Alosa alosa]
MLMNSGLRHSCVWMFTSLLFPCCLPSSNGVLTVETCIQEEQGSSSCVIEHPPMWSHKHLLNITEVNPLGSQQTIIRVDLHQLMKPDPPEAVRSMEVEGHPTRLQVQWRIPESWTPEDISDVAFPLAFQFARHWPQSSKEATGISQWRDEMLLICNLD